MAEAMATLSKAPFKKHKSVSRRELLWWQMHLQANMAEGGAELLQLLVARRRGVFLQPDQRLLLCIRVRRQSLQHAA